MAQTIRLKRQLQTGTAAAGKVPTPAMLQDGELAVNTVDGKIFLKRTPVTGNPEVVEVGANPFPSQTSNANKFLSTDGTTVRWSLPSTVSAAAIDVVQSGHNFTVGTVVFHDGTRYVRSQSDAIDTSDVIGMVSSVNGSIGFILTTNGFVTGLSGLTPGQTYFLSSTSAGVMVDVEPTAPGTVSKPLMVAISTIGGFFYNWRGVANDIPITDIDTLLPTQNTTTIGKALISDGANSSWEAVSGGGTGASSTIPVSQASHGFIVGNLLRYNGGTSLYVKAQANNGANADVVGIVSAVANASDFTITTQGMITGLAGLVAGSSYFLSDATAGVYTTLEPTIATSVSKPVLIAVSTSTALFSNWRGFGLATLLPPQEVATQTGHANEFLSTNGVGTLWTTLPPPVLTTTAVNNAIGYTPYNGATNPNGYVTALNSVTSFNGAVGAIAFTSSSLSSIGGALIASPTFTGTPSAPNAALGTNTTQIATTAFVITNALSSPALTGTPTAPTASVTTNNTQIATTAFVKAGYASPIFTGVPTAPTAAAGTNTTQIATTAFVLGSMPSSSGPAGGAIGSYGISTFTDAGAAPALGSTVPAPSPGIWVNRGVISNTFDTNGTLATYVMLAQRVS